MDNTTHWFYEDGTIWYYQDGSVKLLEHYTNGKQNGVSKGFDENGCQIYEDTYKMGVKIHTKQFDEAGNLSYEMDL